MKKIEVSAFDLAMRFAGTKEIAGIASNPMILAMLRLDQTWPANDEVPWCSAFINFIAHLIRLPRSKSLRARSWLNVGTPILLNQAEAGFDVVILKRGAGKQPGPDVIDAPGHVGFFAGRDSKVLLLGGNQSDGVNVASFLIADVIGVRRLHG